MKKLLIIITLGLVSSLFLSQMRCPGRAIYNPGIHARKTATQRILQVENFWRKYTCRQKQEKSLVGLSGR